MAQLIIYLTLIYRNQKSPKAFRPHSYLLSPITILVLQAVISVNKEYLKTGQES